jgi:AcrR family transcriptional regulator
MARTRTNNPPKPGQEGWQAQKSAMTRETILAAAVRCFIELGYAKTTTAKIAEWAQVSRGAMLHHFPSKTGLIQAAVEYLNSELVALYTDQVKQVSTSQSVDVRNRQGLQAYWQYLSSDSFTAYHELRVASRTNPELKEILVATSNSFDAQAQRATAELFPEWAQRGELFLLAMDVSQFLMEGMAVSQIVNQRDERVNRVLDYLGDRLEEIFHEGDQDAAINRHAEK